MNFPSEILTDDGLFAGYVDSGMWELEEWLESQTRLRQHFELSGEDSRED